jgi:hypothetical protein
MNGRAGAMPARVAPARVHLVTKLCTSEHPLRMLDKQPAQDASIAKEYLQ